VLFIDLLIYQFKAMCFTTFALGASWESV